ncbi:hypothetical protein NPIL_338051 [Nephila pilipes]|uniref:Uncharacterized protein n=1 Tax=Nephila pilipes TaxID=299642 RepID=A0A8X6PVL4_NEPPI|nr:hypothetical protein NPIL_338051 [Nephila pilipes]
MAVSGRSSTLPIGCSKAANGDAVEVRISPLPPTSESKSGARKSALEILYALAFVCCEMSEVHVSSGQYHPGRRRPKCDSIKRSSYLLKVKIETDLGIFAKHNIREGTSSGVILILLSLENI